MKQKTNKGDKKISISDIFLAVIIIPLISFMAAAFNTNDVKHDPKTDLYWMVGTWENVDRPGNFERWDYGLDALTGKGYKVENGKETILEHLKITSIGHSLFYHATVIGQNDGKEITFKLTKTGSNSFTFTNPDHDFPREITYINLGNNELQAIVSDGEPNGHSFTANMKRVVE